jgi:hypothetical protein
MKVAVVISGMPRNVEAGYNQFWKPIIEKYNADVYLHFWEDGDVYKILELYKPKKYISLSQIEFKNLLDSLTQNEISLGSDIFRQFSMFYGWQSVCKLIDNNYDYIIRGRYDLSGDVILENIDNDKINVSHWSWTGYDVCDDNLYVSNSSLYKELFCDIFDYLVSDSLKFNLNYHPEIHFTRIIKEKNLYDLVVRHDDIKFELIR